MPPIFAARPARAALPALVAALSLLLFAWLALLIGTTQADLGYRLSVVDSVAARYLVRFYPPEQNATDTYRWSEPQAAIFLYGFEGRPALVSLRLTAPRPAGTPDATLSFRAGGVDLGQIRVVPSFRRYHLLAPTRASGETALILQTAAYTPAADPRELGVALTDVAVAAAARAPLPPLVRCLVLLSLPLLGWLLALRLRLPPRLAYLIGLALALALGWAAACPSDASYLLPTLAWPWWPALPLLALAFAPQLAGGLRQAAAWRTARPALGWAGLALALLCLGALRVGLPTPLGVAGLLLGTWAGLSLIPADALPDADTPDPTPFWPILLLVGLALALRLADLGGQPAGLWRDESRHGLQALQIWNDPTYRPVYVAEGADLPALLFYLMAPVLGLLGPQVWSDRLVSAVAGGLTPLALWWAAAPLIGRRPALLAAALIAWASWSLSLSRWAFPATLDHLLTLTAVGLAWRGLAAPGTRPRWLGLLMLGLAGFCAGLATYAYHTGRVAPIALAVLVLIRLQRSPAAWRRALPGLAVAAVVGLLTMAPLLGYIAQDYADYNRRVSQVSVLHSNDLTTHTPLGLVLGNIERYTLMWHVRGEPNGRHHLPDAPMLDPVAGLLLLLGLALTLRAPRWAGGLAVIAIPIVYLVPAIFSTDAPHAMRALGTLAPACMLAALALDRLLGAGSRGRRLLALGLLAGSLVCNTWLYFGVMRVDPRVYGEFDLVETAMGQAAQAPSHSATPDLRAVRVYLPEKLRGTDTVRFLTYGLATAGYVGDPLPADGAALLLLSADASPAAQDRALAALGPGAARLNNGPRYPGTDQPIILAFGRGSAAARLAATLWP
ncbi:MAG: hypothetical protein HGA65_12185 [Oscillochloris sp.]|nr:hypothetical protein [Oscillochloris sp.]